MPKPLTVYDSFNEPIPVRDLYPGENPKVHKPSSGTVDASAPLGWVEVGYETWNTEAEEVLKACKSELKERHVAFVEAFRYNTENDVVHASALHLNNPVHVALECYNSSIWRTAEKYSESGNARVDLAYFCEEKKTFTPFVLLEYKYFGAINKTEFDKAKLSKDRYRQLCADPWSQSGSYSFKNKSELLMKQAVYYFHEFKTRYVALCDLNSLMLLYLEDAEGNNGGIRCLGTHITKRTQMRRALLGFIVKAYNDRDTNNRPPVPLGFEKPVAGGSRSRTRPAREGEYKGSYKEGDFGLGKLSLQGDGGSSSSQAAGGSSSSRPAGASSSSHAAGASPSSHAAGGSSSSHAASSSKQAEPASKWIKVEI